MYALPKLCPWSNSESSVLLPLSGVPVAHEVQGPQYNISSADLAHLRATLSKDISEHMKKHVEEVGTCTCILSLHTL